MSRILKFIILFRLLFRAGPVDVLRIERMGLLAVKIAQMYAVRSDLLGVEKCRQLQGLYEQSTPIEWAVVEHVLSESAPEAFQARVIAVERAPLAVASLGQVHGATLSDGTEVVVKVIKPRSEQELERDLRAVRLLATVALTCYPKLRRLADPLGTIDTIARLTRTELDLRNEAQGTATLQGLRDTGVDAQGGMLPHLQQLQFPHIYEELSSQRVLVTQRLRSLSVRQGLDESAFTYTQLLNLFRVQGYFLFLRGQFHGDLHPGNVFYEGEQLWFIDNANVEQAEVGFTRGLLRFLAALGESDYLAAAAVMQEISLRPPRDATAFQRDLCALYADFQSGRTSLTTQMMETVKLCVHAGMEFPAGAFPVIKSLMYLDGMVLKCAPEARLLEDVLAFTSDLHDT